jgi:hypothetical protein
MTPSETRARARLDAWREQHADRLDPIRFHFMEALERRAASHGGEVRRMLDDRLSGLLDAYANELAAATPRAGSPDNATTSGAPARETIGGLVDHMAKRGNDLTAGDVAHESSSYPELAALNEFRKIWSRIRSERQLRQSLEQVPTNAGPLNSGALAYRSIALMRELSPGYLQQFLAYLDDLSWIEQMNDGRALAVKDAPRAASTRKRARSKPRSRSE